jgi:hypothetical protein
VHHVGFTIPKGKKTTQGKYEEEFMAQYKIKDADILDGIVKFIIFTKI